MDNKRRDQLIVATLCDQIKLVEDWQEKGTFRAFLHGQNVSTQAVTRGEIHHFSGAAHRDRVRCDPSGDEGGDDGPFGPIS